MSKACYMSRAIVMVLWGGFSWLNPVVISELVKCSRRMFRFIGLPQVKEK